MTEGNTFLRISQKAGLGTCLFCLWVASHAQPPESVWFEDPSLRSAYELTLNLRVDESREVLAMSDSSRMAWHYLNHFADATEVFIKEDAGLWDSFADRSQAIEEGPDNPWKGFFLSEMAMQKMVLHLKFGEELSAAWQFRQAYRTTKRNQAAYPNFIHDMKPMGLQHVMIGSTPEKYQWILSILGFEGSVEDGFQELSDYVARATPYQLESTVLLAFVNSYVLQKHASAISDLEPLLDQYPDQVLLNYTLASILIKSGHSERALQTLENVAQKNQASFPFIFYQQGGIYLQRGDYDKAITTLQRFLTLHQGHNYRKDSHFKIGLAHWLNGDEDQAEASFNAAERLGATLTEADKYAANALREGLSEKQIYQVRLYTDGGYYDKAKALIGEMDSSKFTLDRDIIEFDYRQARLAHQSGSIDLAMAKYESTISKTESAKGNWYFAPNSALQMGYIYLDRNEPDKAKASFEKALSYKRHPYKNSIDNKAKAALTKIE